MACALHCNCLDNALCSICLDSFADDRRTPVKLRCNHYFHLDCIGSAYNAKGSMECPCCRNIEQGEWLYGTAPPNPFVGLGVEDPIVVEEISQMSFGRELCPFEGLGRLGPLWPTSSEHIHLHVPGPEGGQLCPYIDHLLTLSEAAAVADLFGLSENSDSNSHSTTNSGEVSDDESDGTLPLLIPVSPLPSNPRYFWNGSDQEMITSRYYIAHANLDPSTNGRSSNLNPNAPTFSPYLDDIPMAPSHQGDTSMDDAEMVSPFLVAPSQDWYQPILEVNIPPVSTGPVIWSGQGPVARGDLQSWAAETSLNHRGDLQSWATETSLNHIPPVSTGTVIWSGQGPVARGDLESWSTSWNHIRHNSIDPFDEEMTPSLHPLERELLRATMPVIEEDFSIPHPMILLGGGTSDNGDGGRDVRGGSYNAINNTGGGGSGRSGRGGGGRGGGGRAGSGRGGGGVRL